MVGHKRADSENRRHRLYGSKRHFLTWQSFAFRGILPMPTDSIGHGDVNFLIGSALEKAACALENRAGNKLYKAAWKVAAKIIRSHKPN